MNDPESTQGMPESTQGMATDTGHIANAGGGSEDQASRGKHPWPDARTEQPEQAEQAAPTQQAAPGSDLGTGGQPHAQLLEANEMQSILVQWKEIQAEFVNEPRTAVQDADALVAQLMQRLAQMFASEREELKSRCAGGDEVSTEDLRQGLRRYHSFFERLLAA